MNRKIIAGALGFVLLAIGLSSIILNMNGLQLVFMSFMEDLPGMANLLINLSFVFGGAIIMYLSFTDWRKI